MKQNEDKTLDEIILPREKIGFLEKISVMRRAISHLWIILSCDRTTQKVHRLSVQRETDYRDAFLRVIDAGFGLLPTNADRLDFAGRKSDVVSVEPAAPVQFVITTRDGFVFNDWEGSKKQYAAYWLFRDKVPSHFRPSTHFAASAVYRSFRHGDCRVPGDAYLPKEGGIIVEAGAYVGYKAVAFGRRVGPRGQVVAIELDSANYGLLEKNVRQNGMADWVRTVNCAVWNNETTLTQYGLSRMNNSVARVDEKAPPAKKETRAKTLQCIFNENNVEDIDFLNLQLNGAELEALQGLGSYWDRVKYVNLITRFKQGGIPVVDSVRELIERRGGEIIVDKRHGHLYNLTARLNGPQGGSVVSGAD